GAGAEDADEREGQRPEHGRRPEEQIELDALASGSGRQDRALEMQPGADESDSDAGTEHGRGDERGERAPAQSDQAGDEQRGAGERTEDRPDPFGASHGAA